jgi:hypothetical protein
MSVQTGSPRPPHGAKQTGWEQRPEESDHPMPPVGHPAEALHDAMSRLGEVKEFVSYYIAARLDALRASIRQAGIYAGLGIIAAIGAATVVVVSVVLLLLGIAGAWNELFPAHPWIGYLITAVIFLALPVIGALVGLSILKRTFKASTVQKYENRQHEQRQQYGRSVRDQAAAAESAGGKAH